MFSLQKLLKLLSLQIHSEVRRLEECRASAMRELVVSKARELQAVCAATHVPAPDIQALLLDLNRRTSEAAEGGEGPGRVRVDLCSQHGIAVQCNIIVWPYVVNTIFIFTLIGD